jgi:hypothetical protein
MIVTFKGNLKNYNEVQFNDMQNYILHLVDCYEGFF